ncbi:metallophosphoesterase [Candidatus Fermentibacteria bacterium]|nr:metallophosphoesterase [Candidatus Fermentibacteria bacterium]
MAVICAAALTVVMLLGSARVDVERCVVDVAGLHGDMDGLRIVQLTDFHSSRIGALEQSAFALAADLHPDILAFTGDLTTDPSVARELARRMVALQAPLGVFAIMGNAEYEGEAEVIVQAMQSEGVHVLRNEVHRVSRGQGNLWIIGVDDPSTGRSFLEGALLRLKGDVHTPRLLLAHFPTAFTQAVHWGIDVVLAGHTHGGQVVLPGSRYSQTMGSDELDRFQRGDFREGHTWMHVSRGLGTSKIPIRIGSTPEVTLITLRAAPGMPPRSVPAPP